MKLPGYLEKADTVGHGRGRGHGHFQKALLHLCSICFYIYVSYFSYLMLYLQQPSLRDPGVDPFIVLIHL